MINPSTLDLQSLPKLPFGQKNKLPETSCIYFALDLLGNIRYIGKSMNLRQRWASHHCVPDLDTAYTEIAWLEVSDQRLLGEIELALIRWFKPCLNRIGLQPPNRTLISVKFPKDVLIALKAYAKETGLPVSRVITQACHAYLNHPEQPTLEARITKLEYEMQEVRAIVLRDSSENN